MKFKVRKPLIYAGVIYDAGEEVEILENEVIERVKALGLVETEETEEAEETENTENTTEEKTDKKAKNKKA